MDFMCYLLGQTALLLVFVTAAVYQWIYSEYRSGFVLCASCSHMPFSIPSSNSLLGERNVLSGACTSSMIYDLQLQDNKP
jgi:hypothetical protein